MSLFKSHRPKPAAPSRRPLRSNAADTSPPSAPKVAAPGSKELGGPAGPEPTRYGDWERKGICYDF